MVLVAAAILIKQVFEVMNKNKEVMTLFAMIERDQIEELKKECDEFKKSNLKNLMNVDSEYSEVSESDYSKKQDEQEQPNGQPPKENHS